MVSILDLFEIPVPHPIKEMTKSKMAEYKMAESKMAKSKMVESKMAESKMVKPEMAESQVAKIKDGQNPRWPKS